MKRRKWLGLLLAAVMVLTMVPTMAFAAGETIEADTSWYEKDRTEYTIDSPGDLAGLAAIVNGEAAGITQDSFYGKTISLANDITLNGVWTPIGKGTRNGSGYDDKTTPFKGIFDGQGNKISGLSISSTTNADDALGLFGVVDGGTVKNLVLEDVNIDVSNSECAGGAIGLMVNGSTADEIVVSGTVDVARGNGGVAGRMTKNGTISNCTNNATVTGTGANVGGIVGAAYYTESGEEMLIYNCVNDGDVSGTAGAVGGIVGLSSANVERCVNNKKITGADADVAGIVAEQQNYGSVIGCINNGEIINSSEDYGTGGIVGWIRYNGVKEDYPLKEKIEILNNVNNGNIDGGNDGGGIVGTVYNSAVVRGNENNAQTITGTTFAAGIVGNIQTTESPKPGDGMEIPQAEYEISNNVSTTALENITASSKGQYVYNNNLNEGNITNNATQWVAAVDTDKYTTLQEALDAADGDTVTLLTPINITAQLVISNNVTLDLNGKNLTSSFDGYAVKVNDGKSFTLENGTLENKTKGGVEVGCEGTITVAKNATITAKGTTVRSISYNADSQPNPGNVTFNIYGTLNSNATSSAGVLGNGQYNVFNIDGATINSEYFGVYQNGSYGGAKITIRNSTITDRGKSGVAVYISNSKTTIGNQTLRIEDSVITGATAVEAKYTDVTIEGDKTKLIATGEPAGTELNNNGAVTTGYALAITHNGTVANADAAAGTIVVKDGQFKGLVGVQEPGDDAITEATVAISGGTFDKPVPEEYCAEGFKPVKNEDGSFSVHEHELVKVETVEPTCTEKGTEAYWTCSGCGKMYSDENGTTEIEAPVMIEMIPHDWQSAWSYDANGHWHACSVCGEKNDEADHTFGEWKVISEATSDKDGEQQRVCTVCSYVESKMMPATGTIESQKPGQGSDEQPTQPTQTADDASPTGDDMNIAIPLTAAGLALAAMAAVVATRRRHS